MICEELPVLAVGCAKFAAAVIHGSAVDETSRDSLRVAIRKSIEATVGKFSARKNDLSGCSSAACAGENSSAFAKK